MNLLTTMRRAHLYLGCFFAPILLFFVGSGWYQTMNPDRRKGPGEAEAVLDRLRSVHADSLLPSATANGYATGPFRYFVGVMAVALILTTILGIVLAFRLNRRKWLVAFSLIMGLVVPGALLWLGQKK